MEPKDLLKGTDSTHVLYKTDFKDPSFWDYLLTAHYAAVTDADKSIMDSVESVTIRAHIIDAS
tara:strand:- start:714 stop:902 length:189 start_codon:yes stop_codon:yes gene_type:complete